MLTALGVIFLLVMAGISTRYLVKNRLSTKSYSAVATFALAGGLVIANINSLQRFAISLGQQASLSVDMQEKVEFVNTSVEEVRSLTNQVGLLVENANSTNAKIENTAQVVTELVKDASSIRTQILRTQQDIKEASELADNATRMRIGYRSGWEELARLGKDSRRPNVMRMARDRLKRITADYEKTLGAFLRRYDIDPVQLLIFDPDLTPQNVTVAHIVKFIRTGEDLDQVTYAFFALRNATRSSFPMFNLARVEKWCEEHRPRCESDPAN